MLRHAQLGMFKIQTMVNIMVFCIIATLGCWQTANAAAGPNELGNNSFENVYGWSLPSNFVIKTDGANAHTGVGYLQGNLTGSYTSVWNEADVWPNTSYTFTIWYKGSGIASIYVVAGSAFNVNLGNSGQFTASSTWQSSTFTINTGAYSVIGFGIQDDGAGTMYLDDITMGVTNFNSIAFNPANPSASGMSMIFDDEFNSESTIDVNATGNDGYNWYPQQFFSLPTATSSMYGIDSTYQGATGVLQFNDSPDTFSSVLQTARPSTNSYGYQGTVFTGGDGIYFEARIADANLSIIPSSGDDPTFWLQDMKLNTGLNNGMPGWPGYTEAIENDITEYNPNWGNGNPATGYNSVMGDWTSSPGGPNALQNPGFESGTANWTWGSAFSLGKTKSLAHSGTNEAIVTVTTKPSNTSLYQVCSVAANTTYIPSIWAKAVGGALNSKNLTLYVYTTTGKVLSQLVIQGPAPWRQFTCPSFNSGTNTSVYFEVTDNVTGKAGTIYLDDASLATGPFSGAVGITTNNTVYMPQADVVTSWHTYGELWVPGTAANGWNGYRVAYFDGVPQQALCWIGNQIAKSYPPSGSYLFSLADQDWSDLIIGSDQGGTPTMYLDYVHVYAVNPSASMMVVN